MEVVKLRNHKEEFEKAYDTYADQLYRIAFTYTRNQHTAQDTVQEVFLNYWKKKQAFASDAHERAWFIRSTVNQCHDHYRKYKNVILSDEVDQGVTNSGLSGIYDSLLLLPKKNRSVIILHYLEGYSIKEISVMLHCSVSAVKMRLARGREELRKCIGAYYDE